MESNCEMNTIKLCDMIQKGWNLEDSWEGGWGRSVRCEEVLIHEAEL